MQREDDKELWDILGHAGEPNVSPFFARNVLRKIRQPDSRSRFSEWLRPGRWVPVAGAAVAVMAALLLRLPNSAPTDPDKLAMVDAQDYEIVADLDDLIADDDNSSSLDSALL